jgi:tape measure domain-containing protein
MATIKTAIQIADRFSSPLQGMTRAVNIAINSFEHLQSASSNAVDKASLSAARQELAKVEVAFNEIEQEIRQADQQQKNLNNDIRDGKRASSGLLSTLAGVAATYLSIQSAGAVLGISDELTNTTARLKMVNDGLQTSAELQNMIFQAAERSRGSFAQTADLVAKLGLNAPEAFKSNAEAVHFAEMLNKQFIIAGTNVEGVQSATLQLIQALGSGVLRGEELNAVFEAAPNIIRTVADYLDVNIGKIREMAAEGLITADIVKNAMFSATKDINKQFEDMPQTFSQIWTGFKNNALMAFQPVLEKLNTIANSDRFQGMMYGITNTLYIMAAIIGVILDGVTAVGSFVYDNWAFIAPILFGLAAAATAYAVGLAILSAATIAQTIAAWQLNAALWANPIMLVVLGVIAAIAVFYLAVAAINKFAGTSISATAIVAGVFFALGAFIFNIIAYLWNLFASIVEFFANVWTNPVYSVKMLFANLAGNILDMCIAMTEGFDEVATNLANAFIEGANLAVEGVNWIIDALNEIPGVDLNHTGKLGKVGSVTSNLEGFKQDLHKWVGDEPSNYWKAPKMDMKSIGGAFDAGYDVGKGIEEKFDISKIKRPDLGNGALGAGVDPANLGKNTGDTAKNTAAMKDSMAASEEDLKYLRDLAEQETVNRFTTAEIKVDMSGMQNSINNDMDLDGVVSYLEEKVYETMNIAAEGVHD